MATFHFDLRHVPDAASLRVKTLGATHSLQSHSATTLKAAQLSHPALAALPQAARQLFTHFAEVPDAHVEGDGVSWVQVVRPAPSGVHLDQVILMTEYIPEGYLRAFYRERLKLSHQPAEHLRATYRASLKAPPRLHSAKLHALGLTALPQDEEAAIELLVKAQGLVTTLDTAAKLVSFHPHLANIQPYTKTVVLHDHILPDPEVDPDQFNAMQRLSQAVANPDWAPVIPCKDKDGNLMQAQYDLGQGEHAFKAGQQLYTYGLTDEAARAAKQATVGAMRTAADDSRLKQKLWAPTRGTTSLIQHGTAPSPRATAGAPAYKWTVNERTDHHGVYVDANSIKLDNKDAFSIDSSNSYLRTLYAAYQLLDAGGKPVGDKKLLHSISATNTLMGIPMPTDPTALSFSLDGAAGVQLYFGSMGTSEWDDDVSLRGTLLTGWWQYGVPTIFLVAGKAITSTSLFNKIVNDRQLTAAALAVAFGAVGGALPTASALMGTKKVMIAFADTVLSLVLQKGMEKLGVWLVEQVAEGALSSAFGPVGWVFRLLALGMNVEEMAVTTGEVLSSPACITVKVSRAIDVAVTMHPDPRHGEAGNPKTAVWPAVAKQYTATLQYKNGTNQQLKGELPATTSNQPLPLLFQDVPAGGQFRILVGLYSGNGWLAGSWQSDWIDAKLTEGTTLQLGDKTITENLVPLAPDAQYVFKERVVCQDGDYVWEASGTPPTATRADMNDGTLSELVSMTINNSAFQVGYAWRAANQHLHPDTAAAPPTDAQLYAVQNLSVLTHPGERLKSTKVGFTNRPAIAYAPSTNAKETIDQTNFVLDPRGGGMHLRQVVLSGGASDFGFGNRDLQSWGRFPLENIDAMAVHPSNAVIAASWQEHKLMILNLPDAPSPDDKAKDALMVSGEGIRQGLLQGPKALAVAPDGRLLVLESLNRRVQAFDIKGNPVPSFTPGPTLTTIPTAQIAASLNDKQVPEVFHTALQAAGIGFQFTLDATFKAQLDAARFQPDQDPLIKALSEQGVILSYDPTQMDNRTVSAQIQVVQAGQSWIITDPRGFAWQVLLQNQALSVFQRPSQVEVRVEKSGEQWLLVDKATGDAWRLTPSTAVVGQTQVKACLSYFPMRAPNAGALTYLDMAVEAQGYVYVLAFQGDGSKSTDYLLDVYGPDGGFLFRTPDATVTTQPQNVVAGRIAVDIWRNLYALTYEKLLGVGGATQPGLAHWMPTPPLFTLPLTNQPDLNQRNIGVVAQAFAAHRIQLSTRAFISVVDPEGAWEVKDGTTIYHLYRSGDGLQVYPVPA
ncbi:MAG TPA: hypothetical protein VD973_09265 [Symbiobacteriaceae bacterium]|nr:hypothetical protein [Symbiobacteriaceae bacterium]